MNAIPFSWYFCIEVLIILPLLGTPFFYTNLILLWYWLSTFLKFYLCIYLFVSVIGFLYLALYSVIVGGAIEG